MGSWSSIRSRRRIEGITFESTAYCSLLFSKSEIETFVCVQNRPKAPICSIMFLRTSQLRKPFDNQRGWELHNNPAIMFVIHLAYPGKFSFFLHVSFFRTVDDET